MGKSHVHRPAQPPVHPHRRPSLFGIELGSARAFAWFSLAVLVLSVLMVRVWRDRGVARRLMAVRDNETGAGAMGIPLARTKLLAFALSGFIAGYAGVCLAFATERFSTDTFDPTFSILVVSMVVIGGLGSIDGAVLGAVYLVGIPAIFGTTPTIQFLTSGIGLLAFILYLPGGLAELLHRFGDLVTHGPRAAAATDPAAARPATTDPARSRRPSAQPAAAGGRMSSDRRTGRPGGHRTGPARRRGGGGRLRRGPGRRRGRPVGRARRHRRADRTQRLGQDHPARRHLGAGHPGRPARCASTARAWSSTCPRSGRPSAWCGRSRTAGSSPSSSVEDVLMLTLDARRPVGVVSSTLQLPVGPAGPSGPSGPRWTRSSARSGSTGSAGTASPSSPPAPGGWSTWPRSCWPVPACSCSTSPPPGIAQREAEAFVPLLRRLHQLADTTIVLVEHDVPLVFALCTKVVMMETGSVVSSGTPDEVGAGPAGPGRLPRGQRGGAGRVRCRPRVRPMARRRGVRRAVRGDHDPPTRAGGRRPAPARLSGGAWPARRARRPAG